MKPEYEEVCIDCEACNWKCVDYTPGDYYTFTFQCSGCNRIQTMELELEDLEEEFDS